MFCMCRRLWAHIEPALFHCFVYAGQSDPWLYNTVYYAVWMQTAVTAYFSIRQLQLFAFVSQNTALQSQKVVPAYFTSKQILPFGFAQQNSSV